MRFLRQIGPYGMISALCAGLHLSIVLAGEAIGVHYAVSSLVSFAACLAVGYPLQSWFAFKVAPSWPALARYAAAMSLNYPLSTAAIWLFHDVVGWRMLLAAPAATVSLTAYNFLSSRWAVTHRRRSNA